MDGSPVRVGMTADSPQAEAGYSPSDWYTRPVPDFATDLSAMQAANASCAAFHRDQAAKDAQHALALSQWIPQLWGQVVQLQGKVVELEEWKARTLNDMNRLRSEHQSIRTKLASESAASGEEERRERQASGSPPGISREAADAASLPLHLADHMDPAGEAEKRSKKGKASSSGSATPSSMTVRFAAASGEMPGSGASASAAAAPADASPEGLPGRELSTDTLDLDVGIPRSISAVSEVSHITDYPDEGLAEGPVEGISVLSDVTDGVASEVAHWRIGHFSTKLRGCMGRALVSSPFSMWGLQDLRFMVFPDGKEVAKGPRSRRQKELYAKKVSEGPLEGCLKLKVPECPAPHVLEYYLKIGTCRQGPFTHNFAESTVHGCLDFGIDWLKQVESDHSLTVTVEVLKKGAVA